VHRNLIELLSNNNTELEFKKQVEASLTEHLYVELEYYLKNKDWELADRQTSQLMFNIVKSEEQGYLDYSNINRLSCPGLQKIDKLWFNTDNRFGFRVQKEIWINTENRLGIKPGDWTDKDNENYLRFAKTVGWYDEEAIGDSQAGDSRGSWVSYNKRTKLIKDNPVDYRGSLPTLVWWWLGDKRWVREEDGRKGRVYSFLALRLINCNL
ncbi:GUN4 domain-containing protein, partial [Nostoc sp. UCD120]|uniref:GUN4 domain-containing protein n=3 Tax=unclassified Nostoc TaxID=2593658 RepID=UPI001626069C